MMAITDIAKNLGIIPRMMANAYEDKKDQISSLTGENESLKAQIEAQKENKSKGMKKGGKVSSASKRADGCAQRGKTRGKMV
jgi:hypothetical protein